MTVRLILAVLVLLLFGCSSPASSPSLAQESEDPLFITVSPVDCPILNGIQVCGPWQEA